MRQGIQGICLLKCLDADKNPDPRCHLESALEVLANKLRKKPTLPCDPCNQEESHADALHRNRATVLTPKHCAFRGCTWGGSDDAHLLEHLIQNHSFEFEEVSTEMRNMFTNIDIKSEGIVAAYNESIAVAIRKGAPLANYAIDRRSFAIIRKHCTIQRWDL